MPVLFALRIQLEHWVNIPIWDEWDTPGVAILHAAEHTLSWSDLFAQHNESRKVVPRLLCMALAVPTGWDVRHAMILTFASACLTSALVLVYLRQQPRTPAPFGVLFAWVIINFLLFGPWQYENLLSGFVFEIFIPVLCLFGCAAVNLSQKRLSEKIAWNSFWALTATYSFAHGMLLWLLALPIPRDDERARPNWLRFAAPWYLVFVLAATVSIAWYFIDYRRPEIAPPPAKLSQGLQVIDFIVVWLGALVRSTSLNVRTAGTVVSVIFLLTMAGVCCFLYRNKGRWKSYYPWLLLAGFSLGSGIITAIGRVNLGVELTFNTFFDGFSSMRYNATSVFVYVAIVGMLLNLANDTTRSNPRWRSRYLIGAFILCTAFGIAWICSFSDERTRVPLFQQNRERARTAVIWSKVLPNNPEIFTAYPYPQGFSERVEKMKRSRLLKIPEVSERVAQIILSTPQPTSTRAGFLESGSLEDGRRIRIAGWARNPNRNSKADYVVVGWHQPGGAFHPLTAIATGSLRPDVAQVLKSDSMKSAGFEQTINISTLPSGSLELLGWSVDLESQEAFPLSGALRLDLAKN
jgi:hypothetical protein